HRPSAPTSVAPPATASRCATPPRRRAAWDTPAWRRSPNSATAPASAPASVSTRSDGSVGTQRFERGDRDLPGSEDALVVRFLGQRVAHAHERLQVHDLAPEACALAVASAVSAFGDHHGL